MRGGSSYGIRDALPSGQDKQDQFENQDDEFMIGHNLSATNKRHPRHLSHQRLPKSKVIGLFLMKPFQSKYQKVKIDFTLVCSLIHLLLSLCGYF